MGLKSSSNPTMPRGRKKIVEEAPSNGKLAVKEPEVVEAEVVPEEELPLSESEREDLERLEAQVRSAVWSAAKALWEINTRRLYRERYKTFDDYCQAQFQFSPRYAYYQVKFGQVLKTLEQSERGVQILPQSEYQARPLSKLKEDSERVEAWLESVEKAQGTTPSFSLVDEVVRQKLTAKSKTLKDAAASLSEGDFCLVRRNLAQVLAQTKDSYTIKLWDGTEAAVAPGEITALKFDKRSLPRLKSFFETLGKVKSLWSGHREKTADAVLTLLGQVEGPPSELETKLLNLLEREYKKDE